LLRAALCRVTNDAQEKALVFSSRVTLTDRRSPNQLLQPRVSGPRHRQLRAVGQNREPAVLAVKIDACEPLDVHDERAMDAHEAGRVELTFDVGHRLLLAQ